MRSKPIYRACSWLALAMLLAGAAEAFLQYAGWSAVYSGNYGIPSHAQLVQEAATKADLYFWILAGTTILATVVAASLNPLFKSVDAVGPLRWAVRLTSAVALVAVAIFVIAMSISTAGHYFK